MDQGENTEMRLLRFIHEQMINSAQSGEANNEPHLPEAMNESELLEENESTGAHAIATGI